MLMANDEYHPESVSKAASQRATSLVYKIPVVGWALEGLFEDERPKARLAGLFVLLGGPAAAVLVMGWYGAFLPVATLAALSVLAIAMTNDA